MKKGLLSILAGALLVVGCQNYDDQFSALETQINALASTVAGLSQVQSDLSSLSGTVASLASTVNGLGSQIDTAVADGLSDIQADITAIEAAVADVASSEEVAALQTAVDDSQDDLDELLANSSVFTGDITINSEATLAAYKAMGSSIAIVNGNVDIDVSTTMSQADVQTVVDQILTVTGDFDYTAGASTIAETTFNNLSGVQSLTLKQGGGYHLKGLVSASNIVLDDTWKSTVTIVDLRSLTSVTSLSNEGQANGYLKFDKATEMHLTSLALFGSGGLDLQVKKGGVIDISALDDLNAAGTAVGASYALSIDGPASAGNANIGDGTLTFTNVASVNVSGFIGSTTIGAGVENLTIDGAVDLTISAAADLVTANITGALDSDATLTTADTAGPAITFASTDLTTATVGGVVASINATEQSNLETLTITADTKGGAVTVHDNDDLVTLKVTGAKLGNVAVEDNGDLESVTLDHTTSLATADTGATISITGNTNMTSLTFSADDVDSLTVTGNTQLETINFAGLNDVGTSTSATVNIQSNSLVATAAKDAYDTAPTTSDTGSYTSTSGMSTLKKYLDDAMEADVTTKNITVYFDTIDLVQTQASATAAYADASHTDAYSSSEENAVAYAVTTAASGVTIRETFSKVWQPGLNALYGQKALGSAEGVSITYGGVTKTYVQGTSPANSTLADIAAAINADGNGGTFGSGVTITAAIDSWATSYNTISYTDAAGAAETTALKGNIGWQLGTETGTAAIGTGSTTAELATQIAGSVSGTVVSGVKYYAVASGNAVVLTRIVTNTGNLVERGPNTADFPDLSFRLGNATDTTVDLAAGANTNSTGVSSDFFLSVTQANTLGLRVTVKNNSTTVAFASTTVTSTGTAQANAVNTITALASTTNMLDNKAYVASFAETSTQTAASTSTKDRTSWL